LVLVEGASKKDPEAQMSGRSDTGKRVVIQGKRAFSNSSGKEVDIKAGDYVVARVVEAGASTLLATPSEITTARAFYDAHSGAAWF